METNIQMLSGNRMKVELDGKEIGLIQNWRPNDSYGLDPASGIGDIHVIEHVPTMARHTFSVEWMMLNANNAYQQGIIPENGDAALKGLVFDAVAYAKDDDQRILRKYLKCSYDSGSINISKHAILVTDATFNALDVIGKM